MLELVIRTPECPIHCRERGSSDRRTRRLTLDAKVITYWHDHGIDHFILTRIAAAENRWNLLSNETKPWFREAAIVTVSNRIEHKRCALGYAGHDVLLQVAHAHCHTINRSSGDSRRH